MSPPAPRRRGTGAAPDPHADAPAVVRWSMHLYAVWLFALVLLFTPLTIQLDDIKIWVMHVGGGVLALAFAVLWTYDRITLPPKILWVPYLAFVGVNALSCLALALPPGLARVDRVAAEDQEVYLRALRATAVPALLFQVVLAGWILLPAALVRSRRMLEWSLRLCVLLTFTTTLFGLFHYGGGMSWVQRVFFEARSGEELAARPLALAWWRFLALLLEPSSRIEDLGLNGAAFHTYGRFADLVAVFARNREMLSTILNVQFFGNLLVMLLPATAASMFFMAEALVRRRGEGRGIGRPLAWLLVAGVSTVMALLCIVLTFQKSSLYLVPVVVLAFLALVHRFTRYRLLALPELRIAAVGLLVTAAVVLASARFDLETRLISLERSWTPRAIMWSGATEMWLDNPLLGAGPGAYRVLFPLYRAPDYFLHRINNVTQYSHNWALDVLAETGLLGFVAYALWLGGIFVLGARALRRAEDHAVRVAVIGYLVGLGAMLAGNLATPMSRWPIGAVTLHAFAGMAIGAVALALRGPEAEFAAPPPPRPWDRDHLLRGALALTLAGLMFPLLRWQNTLWIASRHHAEGTLVVDRVPATPLRQPEAEARIREILEVASEDLRRAIALDPSRATTYYKLAFARNRVGDQQGALEAYEALTRINPDYSEIQFNLGVVLMALADDMGDPRTLSPEKRREALDLMRRSLRHFDRAAAQSHKPGVNRNRAIALVRAANLADNEQQAREYAREAARTLERVVLLSEAARHAPRGMLDESPDSTREFALRRAPAAWGLAGDTLREALAMEAYVDAFPDAIAQVVQAYRLFHEAAARFTPDPELPFATAEEVEAHGEALLDRFLRRLPFERRLLLARQERLEQKDPAAAAEHARYVLALDRRAGRSFLEDEDRPRLERAAAPPQPETTTR